MFYIFTHCNQKNSETSQTAVRVSLVLGMRYLTKTSPLIVQQVSITCYFYFHRCCNLLWVGRGFFWIINLSVMCQYRYQKHTFYRSAINFVLRLSKTNNIFWTIVICYSYIFHDLKRCPYALEMRKQITKLDMNMTWNDKSGCQCHSHLFPVLISIIVKLASIPKQPLSELLSLSYWKIVIFLDIQQQNSLFDSEFADVLKCNHCPCVNMEQQMKRRTSYRIWIQ